MTEHVIDLDSRKSTLDFAVPSYVLTAFAGLLQRYTAQNRITLLLGTKAGPPPLAFTVDFSDDPTLAEVVERVAGDLDDTFSKLPYRVAEGRMEFMISPELENDLRSLAVGNGVSNAQFGLRLSFVDREGLLQLSFLYSTGGIDSRTISQMELHFRILFEEITTNVSQRISEIQLLRAEERRKMLQEWNETACGYYEHAVPELFTAQVQRSPNAIALIQDESSVSFLELNEMANRLGHYLRRQGVGPEVLVGTCFRNSISAIVAVLGILKAGGAYVPLDPDHPRERLQEIVNDVNLSFIITDSCFRDRVPPLSIPLMDLDELAEQLASEKRTDFHSGCAADNMAYVIYTSGSTGRPQGVVVTHRSITNGLHEILFDLGRNDEVACLNGSMNVGFMVLGLFLPLLSGVPLVVLREEQYRDPGLLANAVHVWKITHLALPTPALRQLLDLAGRVSHKLRCLRRIQVGGALVTDDLIVASHQHFPAIQLRVAYGSSETGGMVTKGPATGRALIGRPAANARVYILDKHLNPVPIGVIGEIHIASAHLARGYLKRPDLTAARFRRDPFSEDAEARIFATGDLGRYLPQGDIQFLGRSDDQVKIRGYRVHLSEVEAALNSHPDVREAAVTVQEMERELRLVAYVVTEPSHTLSTRQVREYLRERLPEFMLPTAVHFLERFPMTASGKLDRQALPFVRTSLDEQSAFESPRTSTEAFLIAVWKELLGNNAVGIHDNFLECGGDSVFAVRIASRIWDHFGVELPVESLFKRSTIAELAVEIDSAAPLHRTTANGEQ